MAQPRTQHGAVFEESDYRLFMDPKHLGEMPPPRPAEKMLTAEYRSIFLVCTSSRPSHYC